MINVNVSLSDPKAREVALCCPVCGRAVLLNNQILGSANVFGGVCTCGQKILLEALGWHAGILNLKFHCRIQYSDMP